MNASGLLWGWLCAAALLGAIPGSAQGAGRDGGDPLGVVGLPTLELRREYNDVVAAIDTIVRTYGRAQVSALAANEGALLGLPPGARIALLFWADDEAQIYLNGNPVGRTRLTPTRVEIPSIYLERQNELRAHCWDTDRVESGFMAGLYVEDGGGGLHPVITTTEGRWKSDNGQAQEIFYTHSQPDIPRAEVMWGERLFGEVQLSVSFSAAEVLRALQSPALASDVEAWRNEPMHFHQVIARLMQLQGRRQELREVLRADGPRLGSHLRYRGEIESDLSFTLGRAAPLAENANAFLQANLEEWIRQLPAQDRDLVLGEARRLKGVEAVTPAVAFEGARAASGDRWRDYVPPPERGPTAAGDVVVAAVAAARQAARRRVQLWLWLAAAGLAVYVTAGAGQWWRVYTSQGWGRA